MPRIPLTALKGSKLQTRDADSAKDVYTLAESIRTHGQLVPLDVFPGAEADTYIVHDGHRRLAALHYLEQETALCRKIEKPADRIADGYIRNTVRSQHTAGAVVAQRIYELQQEGKELADIAKYLGIGVDNVNHLSSYRKRLDASGQWATAIKEQWSTSKMERACSAIKAPKPTPQAEPPPQKESTMPRKPAKESTLVKIPPWAIEAPAPSKWSPDTTPISWCLAQWLVDTIGKSVPNGPKTAADLQDLQRRLREHKLSDHS